MWICGGGDRLRVKSPGNISDPIFSHEGNVDPGITWTAVVSFQDKRFYSYELLKTFDLKDKPKLQSPISLLYICRNAVSNAYIYVCF